MGNNSNKYPEKIMQYVRQRLGLNKYNNSRDEEISKMSADKVFEHVCTWEGLIDYANIIKSWIKDIYGKDL